jgi:hypothetical protein
MTIHQEKALGTRRGAAEELHKLFSVILESDENCCEIYHQIDTTTAAISFNSSSGVNVAKLVHKMHIGVFFVGKQHVCSYFSLHTYHSTK